MSVGDRSKWNYSAGLAAVVVLAFVGTGCAALLMGRIAWVDFAAGVAPIIMAVLGWVAKSINVEAPK